MLPAAAFMHVTGADLAAAIRRRIAIEETQLEEMQAPPVRRIRETREPHAAMAAEQNAQMLEMRRHGARGRRMWLEFILEQIDKYSDRQYPLTLMELQLLVVPDVPPMLGVLGVPMPGSL